jgi:hypothetical protein
MSNSLFEESEVFVFADGPKENATEADVAKIGLVRKLCEPFSNKPNVKLRSSEKNRGLTTSIISGITEIINRYGKVIVVEDDLELSPGFLKYMNDALNLYESEERVMHVGGYMVPHNKNLPETFFLRAPTIWGWGTWKRAWDRFEVDARVLLKQLEKKFGKDFSYELNINGTYDYTKQLEDIASGKLDTWDIQWAASIYLDEGLCLHPNNSLSRNNGFDGSGVHCYPSELFKNQNLLNTINLTRIQIEINKLAITAFVDFFNAQNKEDEIKFLKNSGMQNRIKYALKKIIG